ncbi:MAG: DUF2339 domain-containing protein, partial [Burkholderiales bacterium]|nr:DUF2339 domain-containing protein [Burkholderiales bacterium]
MWFLGLILGVILGAGAGGGTGAALGAILGTLLGWLVARKPPTENERLTVIEDAIRQLNQRVKALERERPGPVAETEPEPVAEAPPVETSPAVPDEAEPQPATAAVRESGTPEDIEEKTLPDPVPATVPAAQTEAESWWSRLVGGNIVAKAGVVILFLGVGFLLKYAYDNALLPAPLRLAGVALAGAGMFVAGWRLLATRRLYGLILQGGGGGLLYLDVFFGLRTYALIPPEAGFALFMLLGVATTLLAVRQDARILAVLGLSGAFLAPVLAGSETGSHVTLFSYYALLNGFILVVSWFKAWRELNIVGFFFTFIVGLFWGWHHYRPEHFATVEPFMLAFFATYLVIPILFAQRQPPRLKGLVDGTLVFGTPLAAAFMQAGLVKDLPYGLAWSAGLAAALYAALALTLWRRESMRVLAEAYLALAVTLGTLTIAFALDAYPTFALWTLEGAAIVWIGLRQQRLAARLFGLALQAAGAAYFLYSYDRYDLTNPWFNDFVLGCLLIAAASLATAGLMHRYRGILIRGGEAVAALLLVWGCLWWFAGGLHVVDHGVAPDAALSAGLIFVAASVALADFAGAALRWPGIRRTYFVLLAAMVWVAGWQCIDGIRPAAHFGWIAWPFAAIVLYTTLARQERAGIATAAGGQHAIALWLLT